jgi:hypothetical protein
VTWVYGIVELKKKRAENLKTKKEKNVLFFLFLILKTIQHVFKFKNNLVSI